MAKIKFLILLFLIKSGMADVDFKSCFVVKKIEIIENKLDPSCLKICAGILSCLKGKTHQRINFDVWCPIIGSNRCPSPKKCLEMKAERYILKKDRKKKTVPSGSNKKEEEDNALIK